MPGQTEPTRRAQRLLAGLAGGRQVPGGLALGPLGLGLGLRLGDLAAVLLGLQPGRGLPALLAQPAPPARTCANAPSRSQPQLPPLTGTGSSGRQIEPRPLLLHRA